MEISSTRYNKQEEAAIANEWAISVTVKKTVAYVLSLLILSFVTGLLFGYLHSKIFYMIIMLIIGIGHIFIFPKWSINFGETRLRSATWFTALLSVAIFIFNVLSFHLIPSVNNSWALAGTLSFIFPAAIKFSWQYADTVFAPPIDFAPWQLPDTAPDQKIPIFLNSIEIRLRVKIKPYDVTETDLILTVPGRMPTGEMFHRLVIDKLAESINIQLFDKEHKAFAWRFIALKKIGNKMLDPTATLSANQLKQHDIILAERTQQTDH